MKRNHASSALGSRPSGESRFKVLILQTQNNLSDERTELDGASSGETIASVEQKAKTILSIAMSLLG
jgi:hypothetical protein